MVTGHIRWVLGKESGQTARKTAYSLTVPLLGTYCTPGRSFSYAAPVFLRKRRKSSKEKCPASAVGKEPPYRSPRIVTLKPPPRGQAWWRQSVAGIRELGSGVWLGSAQGPPAGYRRPGLRWQRDRGAPPGRGRQSSWPPAHVRQIQGPQGVSSGARA